MNQFQKITKPELQNCLISFFDLSKFARFSHSKDTMAIYNILQKLYTLVLSEVNTAGGFVVKFMGDGAIIIFPEEIVDKSILFLLELKDQIEKAMAEEAYICKAVFSSHFGEIAIGNMGTEEYPRIDVYGKEVNNAFLIGRTSAKGDFIISPQLFRKLSSESRKIFHKFTPSTI